MGKIITGGEANELAGSTIFTPASRCPMYSELLSNGFSVEGSYAQNQLVQQINVTSATNAKTATVVCSWNLTGVDFNQHATSYLYYVQFSADNAEDDGLSPSDPIKIYPNDMQWTGSGTSTTDVMYNDNTRDIVATVWCEYPRGWDGLGNSWSEYTARINNGTAKSGSFYNQASIAAPKESWGYITTSHPNFPFYVDVKSRWSAQNQTYGTTSLRKEINKILNDGE